jgi:polyisoprenoid-binding protein YceI
LIKTGANMASIIINLEGFMFNGKKVLGSVFAVSCVFMANMACAAPVKYALDKEHTTILFYVNHLGFSDKIGRFGDYDGTFIFDKEKPTNSSVDVVLRPAGIDTFSPELNTEIQNDKWFNTAKYPEIHFKSTKIKVTGDNKADITGWLTFMGQEKPATLKVTFNKDGVHPVSKKNVAGFSADTTINRSQFGMNNYVPMVGENVKLHMEVEGVQVE